MPIDVSSDPSGGGLGPDPASTKAGLDPDLGAAGTGAKSAVVDDDKTDFHKDPAGAGVHPKAGVDLHLEDAGRGAKVDPSVQQHDEAATHAKTGALGTALEHVDDHGTKDVSLEGGKHLDVGAQGHGIHETHDDHVKGLHGGDLHDDHDLHGDHHDHDHDAHGHDAHSAVDHHDLHH
jgi:hypothetical protein